MICQADTSACCDAECVSLLSGARRARPRVLFVDNEPRVLEGVRLALRSQRYEIRTATRGDIALDMQRENPFHVIVADECVPGMRGSELLTTVAREFPEVGRVVLTGQATGEAAARAINHAGVARFLLKPCAPKELAEAIEAALRASSAATTLRCPGGQRPLGSARRARPICGRSPVSATQEVELHGEAERPIGQAGNEPGEVKRWQGVLANNELLLYRQKMVALDEPATTLGYELLVRVHLQDGSVLTLPEFASGGRSPAILPSLDRCMIQHLVRMIHGDGRTLCRPGLTILLKVSPQSASDADFVRFLGGELRGLRVAEQVLIAIPEETAVESSRSGGPLLQSFWQSGLRLCIDGVGSDSSRLAALQQLPIGLLNIDATLIRSVRADSRAEAAVHAIVEFARTAGIATAAKGVETTAMAERLRKSGVELGQGYAFGPPETFARVLVSQWPS